MRHLGWAATLMTLLVLAGCSSDASTSPTQAESQASSSSPTKPAIADPLDGTTWRSSFTCDDMLRALDRAGLQKYEEHVLSEEDCNRVRHTTLAFSHGRETINGKAGDLTIPYELVNNHTFIGGFQRVTFQIQGNRMIIHLHIIRSLYPYKSKQIPGEHATDVGLFESAPYERVS